MTPAVISFSASTAELAARIAGAVGGRVHHCGFNGENARTLLPRLYGEGRPVIGICGAAVLIRILAPFIADKDDEPPVLAVGFDGASVVPLLGSERSASRLGRQLADALGSHAALTTASDSRFSRSLDDPPPGWELSVDDDAKAATMSLTLGARIALEGHAPWIAEAGYPVSSMGQLRVLVTEQKLKIERGLVYHPKTLVAGVGCERHTGAAELIELVEFALSRENLSRQSLAAIATVDLQADRPALHALAAHFRVPLRLFTAAELSQERYRITNPSAAVEAEGGTPSVAEAAALKAGMIVVSRLTSQSATCAIGRSTRPLEATQLGRARGLLHIVDIGPGDSGSRTISAVRALDASADWVGAGPGLGFVEDLRIAQDRHRFDDGDEEAQVRHALELAAGGRTVSLVCSGDGRIHALAALVHALLGEGGERSLSDAARRVAIEAHPGVSAVQAASAAAGALIGHDFCCVSLNDGLAPREQILNRIDAAGRADFVAALYDHRSGRRGDLLDEAKAKFLVHRGPDTPVVVASNLGRESATVAVVPLAEFDPQQVDTTTIVLVGASGSRAFTRGDGSTVVYTPRGSSSQPVEAAPAAGGPAPAPAAADAGPGGVVEAVPSAEDAFRRLGEAPPAERPPREPPAPAAVNSAAIRAGVRFLRERARASHGAVADVPSAPTDPPEGEQP